MLQHWIQRLCLLALSPKLILFNTSAALLERLHWTMPFIGLIKLNFGRAEPPASPKPGNFHYPARGLCCTFSQSHVSLSLVLFLMTSEWCWSAEQQELVLCPLGSLCQGQGREAALLWRWAAAPSRAAPRGKELPRREGAEKRHGTRHSRRSPWVNKLPAAAELLQLPYRYTYTLLPALGESTSRVP